MSSPATPFTAVKFPRTKGKLIRYEGYEEIKKFLL